MQGIHGLQPADEVYPRARAAASKALALDSESADAHAAMADIVKGYGWDWPNAETLYLRALELDPQCCLAYHWYANLLSIMDRHNEALAHAKAARGLKPLSVGRVGFVGFTHLRARNFREALREGEAALTLAPNSPIANWFLGQTLAAMGRFQDADTVLSTAVRQTRGASMYFAALAHVCAAHGDLARASDSCQS